MIDERDLFGVLIEEEERLDVPCADGGVWPLPSMSLYTDRARIILHADGGGEVDRSRPTRSGVHWSVWASSISRPTRRRRADARSGCYTLQDRLVKELALKEITRSKRQTVSVRCLYPRYTPVAVALRRRHGVCGDPCVDLRRFYGQEERQFGNDNACRSTAQAAIPESPLRAISSRRA